MQKRNWQRWVRRVQALAKVLVAARIFFSSSFEALPTEMKFKILYFLPQEKVSPWMSKCLDFASDRKTLGLSRAKFTQSVFGQGIAVGLSYIMK